MRFSALSPLIAVLVLAGCGEPKTSEDGTKAEAGAPVETVDTAFRMKPGQYRSTVSIQKFSAEGMPAQMAQMMPKQQSFEYCITPEQAAGGMEAVKQQMAKGKCQYENFSAAGGKMEATFSCNSAPGMSMRAKASGIYNDAGSQTTVVGDMVMGEGKSIHVEQTVKAERIGDCAK